MKYICIKTFTLHDITFQKGNIYIIKTPLSLGGAYRDIFTTENKRVTTLHLNTIERILTPLDKWRETKIDSILK
jgi:hypothetical protein